MEKNCMRRKNAGSRPKAVTHGILSSAVVLPYVETEEQWDAHLQGIVESFAPRGHLETVLVERAALLLWKLARLARYEREIIALRQEKVLEDVCEERRRSPGSRPGTLIDP